MLFLCLLFQPKVSSVEIPSIYFCLIRFTLFLFSNLYLCEYYSVAKNNGIKADTIVY